jgi:hypothetical protein
MVADYHIRFRAMRPVARHGAIAHSTIAVEPYVFSSFDPSSRTPAMGGTNYLAQTQKPGARPGF